MPASAASKVCLSLSTLLSVGIIIFVHYRQIEDRKELRIGIQLEEERNKQKKLNLVRLQQQESIAKAHDQNAD